MNRKDIDMLHGSLPKGILLYAIPAILTSYLQLLFNAADLVVVGRFCGSISVAAVGSTNSLINLMLNMFMGVSVGAGVAVSHSVGAGDGENTSRCVHTAIAASLLFGIFISIVGVIGAPVFLRLMSTPEDILPLASTYVRIYFAGGIFILVYNFCTAILRAVGDTRSPLVILLCAGVVNVVLNVFFVTVLELNVAGVGLATTISQACSSIAVLLVLMRRQDSCKLSPRRLHIYLPQLGQILRIGIPAGIQGSMFNISNVIVQSSMNTLGNVIIAANAASASVEGFCYVTVNAFQQAAQSFIGQNVGARQYDRVQQCYRLCVGYVFCASILIIGVVLGFSRGLLGFFITDAPEAIAAGAFRLSVTTGLYFIFGVQDTLTGCIRGLGASTLSMALSVLSICGFRLAWIFTIFAVPAYHTPLVLYLAYPLSWTLALVTQLIAYRYVFGRLIAGEHTIPLQAQ